MAQFPSNIPEYSVEEFSSAIKRTVEDAHGYVCLRGEVIGFKGANQSSGHAYFQLKEGGAIVDAVVWKGAFRRLQTLPENGLEVRALGKITTFKGKSAYQIQIDSLEPAGLGTLMAQIEARRKALDAEGLFDPYVKQLLPDLPLTIGIVTSPTGAVIRDMLHRIEDRFPTRVLVWGARVQGSGAEADIAAGIDGFNRLEEMSNGVLPCPDVILVARGGGSFEDLLPFNSEAVVRAIARSHIAVVSAVGHETDTTLADFAADVRAPTPTAAAELVCPERAGFERGLEQAELRSLRALEMQLARAEQRFDHGTTKFRHAQQQIEHAGHRLNTLRARLEQAKRGSVRLARQRFDALRSRLSLRVLDQGAAQRHRRIDDLSQRLESARARSMTQTASRLEGLARALRPQSLRQQIGTQDQRLAQQMRALYQQIEWITDGHRRTLHGAGQLLRAYSHKHVLERGFVLVHQGGGGVHRAQNFDPNAPFDLTFEDGTLSITPATQDD